MSDLNPKIKNRVVFLAVVVIAFAFAVWGKLLHISLVEGHELRAKSAKLVIAERAISAKRGNIFSADGKVLATSMPQYNIYMDPVAPRDADFDAHIVKLSAQLAKRYPTRNARQWQNYITENRKKGDRFIEIATKQTFLELQKVKEMPLFSLGKFRGGLVYDQHNFRKNPMQMADRTMGYDNDVAQAGVEGYFSSYLEGTQGKRMMQKIAGGNWKPLNDSKAIEPEDGKDIYTTLDSRIQDVAHRALLHTLNKYNAHHGCVIVMEVSTGQIKAIANLGKNEKGLYEEQRNYAVWESTEPGSTFKLAALMVALEDGKVDTAQIVDTENGIYTIHKKKIKDSNVGYGHGGYGKITLAEAFRKSSNTGIVKAIYPAYQNNQQEFVDRLYHIGLGEPTGIKISGESKPQIPKPGDKSWSGISLPWMVFGYQVSFTPLQMLTFYNAIANNGIMVKPQIVQSVRQHGAVVEQYQTEVLNPAICSQSTVKQLQALLCGVVTRGTASNIYDPNLPMAGKTGTCQLNYWKDSREYQASFAGYFPADNPKYSCIVVINNPDIAYGYYGSTVAAPVFKTIAEDVYLNMPTAVSATQPHNWAWKPAKTNQKEAALNKNYLPSFSGLTAMEAIAILENRGIKVIVKGTGRVQQQQPAMGTTITKNMTVELILG